MPVIRSSTRPARRGAVALFVAVCLVALIGILAIALDGGVLLTEYRHAQAVADAAALATACDLYQNYATNGGADPNGTAADSARATAAGNGYTNDGIASVVTVNIPPLSGDYTGQAGYVEVIAQFNQGRSFSNIFAAGAIAVRARAVAVGKTIPYSTSGILLLDPSAAGSLTMSGNGLSVSGAPITVDSSSGQALTVNGGAKLSAPAINLTGGYSLSNNSTVQGQINVNQPPTPDPLAKLPVPDPNSLPTQSNTKVSYSSGTYTLSPGVYNGGIALSSQAQVTLQPGVYYIQGGGFTVSGGVSLTGNGVMIYNAPLASSDAVNISGSGSIKLTPPSSGIYQGLTIFQSRSSNVAASISGGNATSITGTLYFAGASLNLSGNSSTAVLGTQYISYDLNVTGTAVLNLTWDPNKVARQREISLVE